MFVLCLYLLSVISCAYGTLNSIFEGIKPDSTNIKNDPHIGWLVGFVALRPKSTAMVIAGRSVHLTTLFPGQA